MTALQGLRPRGIEAMMGGYSIGSSRTPIYMPIIDNNILITSSDERSVALDSIVTIFAECLGQDYMQLGSMMGTKLGTSSLGVSFDATLIQDLLDAGLEYVVAGDGKLLAMMHIHRSVLVLRQLEGTNGSATSSILPISLSKRRKDMSRVFRNKLSPEDKLSLKVNSNFDLALLSLRDHHGDDCWIDAHLENVWRAMFEATPPQLIVFELWYNDELIAADFGHSCAGGKSFYVATRFFSRHNEKHKLLQPGFLLALAETKALKDRGYFLWDLGGVNRCPLMQYKYDLTGESVERPIALQIFRDIRNAPSHNDLYSASVPPFHQNMIISEKLGLDDLLS